MNDSKNSYISEAVRDRFVGRTDPLDTFYQRFAYRHMKNGVYYYGSGGSGKTWILQKIMINAVDDPTRDVVNIIDFFDTKNHSIRGLQSSIRERLGQPEAFDAYDRMIDLLELEKAKGDKVHPSSIASIETRIDQVFIDCCKSAVMGREVILLFDTFEKVQQRYVGQWLTQNFLAEVRSNLVVAIAGRSMPGLAKMPDNIEPYKLSGFNFKEMQEYIKHFWPAVTDDIAKTIWERSDGLPLVVNLILDLPFPEREEFVNKLSKLEHGKRLQETPTLQRELVGQFAHPPNQTNRVIWAMSYLHKRFDVPMLKYVVESTPWFATRNHDGVLEELTQSIYIKDYPSLQSHLLHDEIQRMVYTYILEETNDPIWQEMRSPLYELVVKAYYTNVAIPQSSHELQRQLQAEQLGYILDHNPTEGLQLYEMYRKLIETTHEYDFEELLWGEVREHLDRFEEDGFQICVKRGQWLRKHNLFPKSEEHYREMINRYSNDRIATYQSLGFMLLRQGKLTRAKSVFLDSLELVANDDYENLSMIENNLGQTAVRAGRWDEALAHYIRSFRAATYARSQSRLVSVYTNRGYLYSLQGQYDNAKQQCEEALKLLESFSSENSQAIQQKIYAGMNLGTAFRHSGEYSEALKHYRSSLELAEETNNPEAISNLLQHIGVNEHLMGRQLRQQQKSLGQACGHQLEAWQSLTQSLEIARRANWRTAIANGLNRLAKVYGEIYRLQEVLTQNKQEDFQSAFQELTEKAILFEMPFGVEYQYDLLINDEYSELNWLGKAARMFEVSGLVANEVNDFHRALESLTEMSLALIEMGYEDKVSIVVRRIERIKGYDYQERLFTSMIDLILGDLEYKRENYKAALERYKDGYTGLAKQSGYATYILDERLLNLEWRLQRIPSEVALVWCDALEDHWLRQSLSATKPAMTDLLERIRLNILKQRGK